MYKQLLEENKEQLKSRLQKEKRELENKKSLSITEPIIQDVFSPQIFEYENEEEEFSDEFHSSLDKKLIKEDVKKKKGRPSKRRE